MPLAAVLLWGTQFAFAIEAWRARSGPALGAGSRRVGELEALASLAGYAYEHPADPFPESRRRRRPASTAEALGHPLLPAPALRAQRRRARRREPRLLIVSGSNMSGKSTLLRTVGIERRARAGRRTGPRRAGCGSRPLAIGATLRIQDSLQEGSSRFYAEITRAPRRSWTCARGRSPLLFLLDEILHGTNSHDRRIGAEAVVRGAARARRDRARHHPRPRAGRRSPTHRRPGPPTSTSRTTSRTARCAFDYRMRPGVVTKSNALALMRAVGLEV